MSDIESRTASELSALMIGNLSRQFYGWNHDVVVIDRLLAHLNAGEDWALEFGQEVLAILRGQVETSWAHSLSRSCIGVTQMGFRCNRTSPHVMTSHGDEPTFYLCSDHLEQAPQVWSDLRTFFRAATQAEISRISMAKFIEEAESTEHVYFMSDGRHVKVGKSTNPDKRLLQIKKEVIGKAQKQTLVPDEIVAKDLRIIATIPGGHAREHAIHRALHEWHVVGEWFRITEGLVRQVRALGVELDQTKQMTA
jgi:hypothetical protein